MGRAVKVPQLLIGTKGATSSTPSTPATAVHTGGAGVSTLSGSFKMESDLNGAIGLQISWGGGSLTTAPLIVFSWSPDAVNFFADSTAPSTATTVATGAAPASPIGLGPYIPPVAAKAAKVTVTNRDNTRDITVLAMAGSIDYIIGSFGNADG